MSEILDLEKLKERIHKFAKDRDWEQFHNPKNLAMALSVEASELVEIFQWLTLEQADKISENSELKKKVEEEISDIVVYAIRMCTILGIDLPSSIDAKMIQNAEKYPIEKAKGNAKKYSEL